MTGPELVRRVGAPAGRRRAGKAAAAPARPAARNSTPQADAAASLGNRGLQRLLAGNAAALQPKLVVGPAHDALEQEADAMAYRATQAGPNTKAASTPAPTRVQRRSSRGGAREGTRESTREVSKEGTKEGAGTGAAPASVERALADGGRPLAPALQADMGQRLGHDFSGVRVHTGDAAARSARDIHAHAYTAGRHVVFGAGRYAPHTPQGRHLLAHELAHTLQQGQALQAGVVQRDFAGEPTVADPAEVALTEAQLRNALRFDRVVFTDAAEIEIVRDVLGIARQPALIDADLVHAIARYQASYGLTADGMLGAGTAAQLEREIGAESDVLGDAATGTPLRRVARRLHLRALASRRTGLLSHQGFVGNDANPEGVVTARLGETRGGGQSMSLDYSGENADRVDWLQFVHMRLFATPPGAAARVFRTGTVGTSSGPTAFSTDTATNWSVDGDQAGVDPIYNATFDSERLPSRTLAMFDRPGGGTVTATALAFAGAGGPAAGATTVTFVAGFESYVVRNNRVRYRVAWTASTVVNIAAATASGIMYSQGAAQAVTGLSAVHRTALLAEYPGNPIR